MRKFLIAVILLCSSTCLGFGPAGHKIVASIAFRQLTPEQQAKIVAMLKLHPRFRDDFVNRMPDGVEENEWIFQQAAIWPDIAKTFKDGAKAEFDRPIWHYIDLPVFPTDEDRQELKGRQTVNLSMDLPSTEETDMNIVQAFKYSQHVLDDPRASKAETAKHLCWLFHLAGDAHQPLHAAMLCTTELFPKGDKGGNHVNTEQKKELHALWDGFPGSGSMKFAPLRNKAIALSAKRALRQAGEQAAHDLSIETWIKESHRLAEREAYTQEILDGIEGYTNYKDVPAIELSDEYLENGGEIIDKRLVEAGFRLAGVLKKIATE